MHRALIVLCTAALLIDWTVSPMRIQSQAKRVLSEMQYDEILNTIFPQPPYSPSLGRCRYILRFLPSSHPESEVVIEVTYAGKVNGWLYTVSGKSAWQTGNEQIQREGASIADIAKSIRVVKRPFSISSKRESTWRAGFVRNLNESDIQLQQEYVKLVSKGKAAIVLDGTTYELWFSQGTSEIHWQLMDSEVNDIHPVGHFAIVRWMNKIRQYAISRK